MDAEGQELMICTYFFKKFEAFSFFSFLKDNFLVFHNISVMFNLNYTPEQQTYMLRKSYFLEQKTQFNV